jgi:hypothetical protein
MPFTAAQLAWARLLSAPTDLKALRDGLSARLDELAREDRWSPEHRTQLAQQARDQAAAELATVRQQVTDARRTLADRPDPQPADSSAALLREQREARAWDRLRPQLDKGRQLGDVLAELEADRDTSGLWALRAELPAWAAAQHDYPAGIIPGGRPADPGAAAAVIRQRVDLALARTLPAGPDREAVRGRLHEQAWGPVADAALTATAEAVHTHSTAEPMGPAFALHFAEEEARRITAAMEPTPATTGNR